MSTSVIVLPTVSIYQELVDTQTALPCIMELEELVNAAILKHFQGRTVDLHSDPLFQSQGRGVEQDIAVGIAEGLMEHTASLISDLFTTSGVDPREIDCVRFVNRNLLVQMRDGYDRYCAAEGLSRCIVSIDRQRQKLRSGR